MPIPSGNLSLDRAKIQSDGRIEAPAENPDDDSDLVETCSENPDEETEPSAVLSKRQRFSIKTKKILHIIPDSINPSLSPATSKVITSAPILADAPDTVSDARLIYPIPKQEEHNLKDLLHDPIDTIKDKVSGHGGQQIAANIAAKEISHGQDVESVRAHEKFLDAKIEKEKDAARNDFILLIKRRQDVFTRWTMDRHVTKVRILPEDRVRKMSRKDFIVKGPHGEGKMDWSKYGNHSIRYYAEQYGGDYIGATCDPPVPSKDVFMSGIEKLLVASEPLQNLIMTTRRIYRWESRRETAVCLGLYSLIWVLDIILPSFLFGIIYLLVCRKFAAPNIEDLREDIIQTEDVGQSALSLSEFIQKKGDKAWVEPLVEQLGPWTLIQLSDAANSMEVLRNFYEWRVPSRTAASTAILTLVFISAIFTPTWLIVRASTFIFGLVFFGLFPVGSHFPDYRYLVSPLKLAFWKIPTHAEWAIKALQAEGARHRSTCAASGRDSTRMRSPMPDPLGYRGPPSRTKEEKKLPPTPEEPNSDYGSYNCHYEGQSGKLILNSTGIRVESSIGHTVRVSLNYSQICRLEKVTRLVQKAIGSGTGEDLQITGPDGRKYMLSKLEERNQAFTQIVGFSPVTWQVVW